VAFAFEGIAADELIGDFGFHGGGAAQDGEHVDVLRKATAAAVVGVSEDLDRRLRKVRTLEEGPPEARVGAAAPSASGADTPGWQRSPPGAR
jgi:hypothetical protein